MNFRGSSRRTLFVLSLLGLTLTNPVSLFFPHIVNAQPLYQFSNPRIKSGSLIPITYEKEKIIVTPQEIAPVTLTVNEDIKTPDGLIIIPNGSKINGQIQPANPNDKNSKGSLFIAQEVIRTNGQKLSINAVSGVVSRTTTIQKGASTGSILTGAAIGATAATILAGITGDKTISPLEVLGGAAIGTLGGVLLGRRSVEVLVIYPQQDLTLTVQSDIVIN